MVNGVIDHLGWGLDVKGIIGDGGKKGDEEVVGKGDDWGEFGGLGFKVMSEGYVGKLRLLGV